MRQFWVILTLILSAVGNIANAMEAVGTKSSTTVFDFGEVVQGQILSHEFVVTNNGKSSITIRRTTYTSPIKIEKLPSVIAPGTTEPIRIRLNTKLLSGSYEGVVNLEDPQGRAIVLTIKGTVTVPIAVTPQPSVRLVAHRNKGKTRFLEITNHSKLPLEILDLHNPSNRFIARLDTVEKGVRYRLSIDLNAKGPGGKSTDTLLIKTNNKERPEIPIVVYTNLIERVYTFPDVVDFGALPLGAFLSDDSFADRAAQTLMVYQTGGNEFEVTFDDSLGYIQLDGERGPKGDRYQLSVSLDPLKIKPGIIKGFIKIQTNDTEFPLLSVPVTGWILEK